MGRTHNPDYYKVGGGTAGSGVSSDGRFGQDRARYAGQKARLEREKKVGAPPPAKPAPSRAEGAPSRGELRANRPSAKVATERPAKRREEASEPPAIVRELVDTHARHGKKRRSSKKRHDVAVEQELARTREAHHAGVAERERPPAPVTDLGDRRAERERAAASRGPSTLPPKAQGLVGRAFDLGKEAFQLGWELVTAPITVARLLARLREREG